MKLVNQHAFDWESNMRLALNGDMDAYRSILEKLGEKIDTHLQYRIFDKEDIPDICQDILISIHNARHTYQVDKPFLPWVMAITKYKTIDYIKKKTKQSKTFTRMENLEQEPMIAESLDNLCSSMEVEALMATLKEKEKELLSYVKLEGYSVKEASVEFNLSESNVKTSVHRIIKKLKVSIS